MSLSPLLTVAQLSAPGMSAVRYTAYPLAPALKDPVFIFCNSSGSQKGTIQANSPGGSGPFTFSWYKWSELTNSFSIFIKSGIASNDTIINRSEGGYRVRITDSGTYDTTLVGWIHLDKPYAEARIQNFTCDYVALNGKAAIDTFYYRDPIDGRAVKLPNDFTYLWTSTPVSTIPYPSLEINPVTFSPPLEDVVYKLLVTDSFLCASESSFPYTSIHVKADFTASPITGEAPLAVDLLEASVRGYIYKWEFGDDSVSGLQNPPPHIYYRPGEYYIKLTIESNQGCVDSLKSEKIVVDPSSLDIPNVFTPDGDGNNDIFTVESKSLRSINVEIFSRSGLLVYTYSGRGEKLKEWQGWDGNVNQSSVKASPGVYFYIISALGWDDKSYDGKKYRGFLYLYR